MKPGFQNNDWSTMESGDFRNFKLLKAERYLARDGTLYELPQYAPSDLASVPPEFWGAPLFLTPFGWYAHPAYLHDCGFQNTLLVVTQSNGCEIKVKAALTEAKCNALILEAMQLLKPEPSVLEAAQMKAIYEGVALFGWHAFNEDRS